MRHTLPVFIGAAMIILAGCSSKSAVSTDETAGSGYGHGGAAAAGGSTGGNTETRPATTVAGPVIGDIFFDFDSSALSDEAQEQLKQNAAWMQKNPAPAVSVEGHCDERGTDEYNIALGERRAEAAQKYLVNLGVSGNRLSTVSYGEEHPFDPGHNEEAWSKNRRDHFVTK
jgi:peptidoglycan-associated lipoprotein